MTARDLAAMPLNESDLWAGAVHLARREMVQVLLTAADDPEQKPEVAAALRECASIYEGTHDDVRD